MLKQDDDQMRIWYLYKEGPMNSSIHDGELILSE